uniref:Uncharacterized protein n=1 Tax=Chenopodium quinoa TaxID=63459 RepID=A0A803MQF2_CHEQI
MQSQLVQQLAPSVTTAILTQLRDANPGINLVIPDFAIPSAPKDASSAPHLLVDQNGQSSKSDATINQGCIFRDRGEGEPIEALRQLINITLVMGGNIGELLGAMTVSTPQLK